MADFIGVSGSATYAVALTGIEELLNVLPDNTVNQIRAQDVRNAFWTLFELSGGSGTFLYTQAAPLTVPSTTTLGGLSSGRTFSQVPINEILDTILFPAKGTEVSVSLSQTTFESGFPSTGLASVNVTVSIKQNTFDVKTATISDNSNTGNSYGQITLPAQGVFGDQKSTVFSTKTIAKNSKTTFSLTVTDDQGSVPGAASTEYFYPRFYGSIDLSSYAGIGSEFQFTPANAASKKNQIVTILTGNDVTKPWKPVWNVFGKVLGQLSSFTITPPSKSFGVLVTKKTDPIAKSFQLNGADPPADCFILLGSVTDFKNEYGVQEEMNIFIRDFASSASISYKSNY